MFADKYLQRVFIVFMKGCGALVGALPETEPGAERPLVIDKLTVQLWLQPCDL